MTAGGAMVPVVLTGTRECEHHVRARTPRRSATLEVAPDVSILRRAQNRYVASDALASMTEATRQHRSVSRRTRRSRFAWTPGHPSRDVFQQAASRTADYDPPPRGRRNFYPTVLRTANTALQR